MKNFTKKSSFILCAVLLFVSLAACSTGRGDQSIEDGEPAYWNGLNFGPNLAYAEEFKMQSDPGESLNAAEAAKLTFDTVRDNGYIPEYNDKTDYTLTLIDLTDMEGEEAYVYRLDVDEPTGTIGAAYAYACRSGNIYMQGYGGQWVIVVAGDPAAPDGRGDLFTENSGIGGPGDTNTPEWQGDYTATAYVIAIDGFDGTGFNFEAYKLDAPARLVASGFATLSPENDRMADYGQLSFSLNDDSALDISTPEDHNLSGLRGHYVKNESNG